MITSRFLNWFSTHSLVSADASRRCNPCGLTSVFGPDQGIDPGLAVVSQQVFELIDGLCQGRVISAGCRFDDQHHAGKRDIRMQLAKRRKILNFMLPKQVS